MIVHDPVDVCVVGLGAAGGTIATGLAERGLRVVGLEAGPARAAADYTDDEVAHVVDRRLLWSEPEVLVYDDGPPMVGSWLARNIGVGGPHVWSGFSYRFHPSDFAGWPIGYADLEPWYDEAETRLRVAGLAGENPFEAPRRGPYPQPPLPRGSGAERLADAARTGGLRPYHPPAAIDRAACTRCGLCTFYGCHVDAKWSTRARGTDRLDVRAGCLATAVTCDAGGRPGAVRYVDAGGTAAEQPATVVVLAANAPYVARLLLVSGIGNDSDQVGRHLTFHTGLVTYGVYDELVHADRGPAQHVGVDDFNEERPAAAGATFTRGGVLHGGMPAAFTGGPLAFARLLDHGLPLPDGVPLLGDGLLRFAAHAYPRHQAVYALGEDVAQPDNWVTLDPDVTGAGRLPAVRMTYRPHPEDMEQQRFLLDRARELLERSGAVTIAGELSPLPGGMVAGHAHGTTRMGHDPDTSVADDAGLVHGTDNLFVAGAGLFVTAAGLNPALTIVALALRATETIADAVRA